MIYKIDDYPAIFIKIKTKLLQYFQILPITYEINTYTLFKYKNNSKYCDLKYSTLIPLKYLNLTRFYICVVIANKSLDLKYLSTH